MAQDNISFNNILELLDPIASTKRYKLTFFKHKNRLEKWFYPFTLCNIFAIGYLMGRFPNWFHIYYTTSLFILMPIRFITYYNNQNHYFLADLCYFVNLLCIIFIWFKPNSNILFQSCFALCFGSLSFAVITWRNSLVLHSIDKITSCFIHIIPTLSLYIIYYELDENYKLQRFPGAIITESINLKKNIFWTSVYYLIWQSLYHYFITLKKSRKIQSGQRMTSFQYLTNQKKYRNLWFINLKAPWPMIIYTLLQYLYQLCTMLLCSIWLRYKWAASLFLCYIFWTAAFNGATYYIDVYAKNSDVVKIDNDKVNKEK
ncbi:glycerophosphocholine acyltransferase 1 [Monosporozyma servazzii]